MSTYNVHKLREYLMLLDREKRKEDEKLSSLPEITKPEAVLAPEKAEEPTAGAEAAAKLNEALKNEKAEAGREELRETAKELTGSGQASADTASRKNAALYEALTAFLGKQDGRYDGLIEAILGGDYAASAGATALRDRYTAAGERAAGHAAADRAAENGGNPDSYATAQANRQRLAFTEAGEEAAADYYGEQLDRLLTAIGAASKDVGGLLGQVQDNADADAELAKTQLGTGESLFSSILSAENDAQKISTETLIELYDKLIDGRYAAGKSVSPMQIDREFDQLTGYAGGKTRQEALLILWDKYPTMHPYILEKYDKLVNPDYTFN